MDQPKPQTKPDIHRLLAFQQLLLRYANIERLVPLPNSSRHENDLEHSGNLALTAWFLCGHFPELDRDTVIRLALAHDLVEVYAGDTSPFAAPEVLNSKDAREANAAQQLANEWPDFPDLFAAIEEYKQRTSAEAKFVYALDKVVPVLIIYLDGGRIWRRLNVTSDQHHAAKRHKVAVSPSVEAYYEQLYQLLLERPEYFAKPSQ